MASSPEAAPERTGNGLNGLSQHREFLLDFMDPEFGLLDKILGCRALTKREVDRIKAKPTFHDKNAELLERVANGHKIAELISCLRDSRQEHIVKYLEENGDYKTEFDGCWPLTDEEITVLDINHECLVDLLETGDLISKMVAKGVLNYRQKDFIASKATPHEKNEALLDILRRRSLTDYFKTIACLKESNQEHIAEILETKAATVSLHANLDDTVVDLARAEDEIASRIAGLLRDRSPEESQLIINDILGLVDAKLIGAKVGNSVVLYFLCSRTRQLIQLRRCWAEGRIAKMAEELFNRVLSAAPRFGVTVKWNEEEYRKTKEYIERLEEHSESILTLQRQLFDLPLELQDMILQRVCLHQLTCLRRNKEIFISLAPVSISWFHHLRKQRFISRLFRHLAVYYRSLRKRATIIRNNDEFLSELIQPKDFAGRMRTSDCLTDLQFRCINRRKRLLNSAFSSNDILHAVRSFDDQRTIAFRECLRQTRQEIVADVLESGGAAIKATVRSEPDTNRFLTELRFVEKIHEICRGNIPIALETESILKRLKNRGTEILTASHDRAIVLWIHCTSVDAFANLQLAEGTAKIVEDISDLLRSSVHARQGCSFPVRTTVIDCQTFDKTFVTCTSNVNFAGRLQLNAKYFYGIATLDNHIYALCQSPNSLNVFQDEQPFSLVEVIALEEIKTPEDIGSSTKDSCLYITDSGKKCLWRKSGRSDLTVWISDVDWPFTVSVLWDGRVLLPRKGQPCHVELYSRRGVLLERIQLTADIIDPYHGVQTRRGLLVVSHWYRDSVTEGVFAMNGDGLLVRRFLSFGPDQHITFPRYLTLDDADRVFVTDFDGNQVIQMDPDLRWSRILLGKDSAIEYPERLCYNAGRQQLLVGHSGGIDVFIIRSQ